jgi:hypothetical protein
LTPLKKTRSGSQVTVNQLKKQANHDQAGGTITGF